MKRSYEFVVSKASLKVVVLHRSPCLRLERVHTKEAPDVRHLSIKSHLRSLSLATETAKAVLDDGMLPRRRPLDMSNDAVYLELQLRFKKGCQSAIVDKLRWPANQQNAAGVGLGKVLLLGRLDAIPHHARHVLVDRQRCAAIVPHTGTLGVKGVGDVPLEENHLGRAAKMAAGRLRPVDVDCVDATRGTKLVNGCQELVGCQCGREVDDEERTIHFVGNVLALIVRQSHITPVVWAEP